MFSIGPTSFYPLLDTLLLLIIIGWLIWRYVSLNKARDNDIVKITDTINALRYRQKALEAIVLQHHRHHPGAGEFPLVDDEFDDLEPPGAQPAQP
jgi:hypothetical protein